MEEVVLLRVAVEIIPVEQPCQMVPLRPADQVPVLGELDGPADARHDDLMAGIGLGDKVAGAGVQAFHLGFGIRGQHDDRDAGEVRVLLDPAEDIQPVDIRQDQVQQHQAQCLAVSTDGLQGLGAGLREEELVVILQVGVEQLPVDELILNDQDLAFPVPGIQVRHAAHSGLAVHRASPFEGVILRAGSATPASQRAGRVPPAWTGGRSGRPACCAARPHQRRWP